PRSHSKEADRAQLSEGVDPVRVAARRRTLDRVIRAAAPRCAGRYDASHNHLAAAASEAGQRPRKVVPREGWQRRGSLPRKRGRDVAEPVPGYRPSGAAEILYGV